MSFITDFGGCCLQNISKLGHPRSLRLLVVCPSGPAVAAAAFFNSGFAPSFSFSNGLVEETWTKMPSCRRLLLSSSDAWKGPIYTLKWNEKLEWVCLHNALNQANVLQSAFVFKLIAGVFTSTGDPAGLSEGRCAGVPQNIRCHSVTGPVKKTYTYLLYCVIMTQNMRKINTWRIPLPYSSIIKMWNHFFFMRFPITTIMVALPHLNCSDALDPLPFLG